MEATRPTPIRHGRLGPGELAEVAVLGDLALVLEVIGWFAPLGSIFQALATIPFAVLAARHRVRAAAVATVAAAAVGSLVGGVGIVLQTGLAGALGLSIGVAHRRGWSAPRSVAFTLCVAGLPIAALTDAIDAASSGFRRLSFAQVRIIWRDLRNVLGWAGQTRLQHFGDVALSWAIDHWWASVPAAELVFVLLVAVLLRRFWPFLDQVRRSSLPPMTDEAAERTVERERRSRRRRTGTQGGPAIPMPVPVRLEDVSYSYAGAPVPAIEGVTFELRPGRMLALVGPNGSGKSTLVRILAGRIAPSSGAVVRGGPAGLGLKGGTAIVFQRPESQVLGVRVRDDVVWGLAAGDAPDVGELLGLVGLGGFEERETSGLSGGELQRLAMAAALARSPSLLISDEATAMIDHVGRRDVVNLLQHLASSGLAIVHVTHRLEETDGADDRLLLAPSRRGGARALPIAPVHGRISANGDGPVLSPKPIRRYGVLPRPELKAVSAPEPPRPSTPPAPLVSLRGVGYVYAARTPWAHRALNGVDLEIRRGEGVVVTGSNGSGKSTLAWLLGGLTTPTEGQCLLDGEPIADQPERVGVSFQHARLQLLRPTVLADVTLGSTVEEARRALRTVGLDPDEMGPRRVDDLSGGEQRRVALAGLLVRGPDLIVLDEPYAGLDDDARLALAATLRSQRQLNGVAVVVVTHDLDNAELLGGRVIHLENGRIVSETTLRAPE